MMGTVIATVKQHRKLWWALTGASFALYYVVLLVALIVRFGALPNYVVVYELGHNYAQILRHTPALSDALQIMTDEPWLEIGYRDAAYFNIAEWSFMLMPLHVLATIIAACLLATAWVLAVALPPQCRSRSYRSYLSAAGAGAGLLGVANATLTWVVCCATPSWVVLLSMLGISTGIAQFVEPLGPGLIAAGFLLCVGAIAFETWAIERARDLSSQMHLLRVGSGESA